MGCHFKMTSPLFLIFLLFAGTTKGEVFEADDSNFNQTIASHDFVLVDFYAPWCSHCVEFAPEFSAAAEALKEPNLSLVKVNCNFQNSTATQTCNENKVRFLPYIVLFKKGQPFRPFGNLKRDNATVVNFVHTAIENPSLLDTLQSDMPPKDRQPMDSCDVKAKDEGVAPSADSPAVLHLDDKNFQDAISKNEYVIVDFYAPWCSDCQRLSPLFDTAALQLKADNPSLRFAKVLCDKGHEETTTACSSAHLKFLPWVTLFHNSQRVATYPFENVPDTNTIFNFIEDGMRSSPPNPLKQELPGTVRKIRKALDTGEKEATSSEAEATGTDGASVLELDDKSFEPTVKKYPFVLVNFYAPWCFHCKKMASSYSDVATELASHKSVRLAEVDCSKTNKETVKTCGKFSVNFLPTIFLFHKGKNVDEFDNTDRTKETILSFINDSVDFKDLPGEKSKDDSKKKKKHAHNNHKVNFVHKALKKDKTNSTAQDAEKKVTKENKTESDSKPESLEKIISEVQPQDDEQTSNSTVADQEDKSVKTENKTEVAEKKENTTTVAKEESKQNETKTASNAAASAAPASSGAASAADVIQAVAQNMLKALTIAKPEDKKPETPSAKESPKNLEDSLPDFLTDLHSITADLHEATQDLRKIAEQQQPAAYEKLVKQLQNFMSSKSSSTTS